MEMLPGFEVGILGIGDHNTISTGPDEGANTNLRNIFWKSMGHATFAGAVDNWLSRLGKSKKTKEGNPDRQGAGNLNIGGHGNEGFLTTGAGQHGTQDYTSNVMLFWSAPWWGPHFSKLAKKNFPMIYIYSCHSGAGERGADFLFAIAQQTGHPVAGRTGFLYSNSKPSMWYEAGSTWQVATPQARPTPINPPSPHRLEGVKMSGKVTFVEGDKQSPVAPSDILSIEVKLLVGSAASERGPIKISENLAMAFMQSMCASEPMKMPGLPLAMKTAQVTLAYKSKSGNSVKEFTIYNDRLAVDKAGVAYYTSSDFGVLLANL